MNDSPLILGPALAPSCAGLIFVFTFGSRTQGGHQPLEPFTTRYGALFHSTVKDIEKCGDDDCYGSKADVCARNARLSALGQRRTSCLCPCMVQCPPFRWPRSSLVLRNVTLSVAPIAAPVRLRSPVVEPSPHGPNPKSHLFSKSLGHRLGRVQHCTSGM